MSDSNMRIRATICSLKLRSRQHGVDFCFTEDDWQRALVYFNYSCAYCGQHKDGEPLNADHFIALSYGGPTTRLNIVPACRPCNSSKGGVRIPAQWLLEKFGKQAAGERLSAIASYFQSLEPLLPPDVGSSSYFGCTFAAQGLTLLEALADVDAEHQREMELLSRGYNEAQRRAKSDWQRRRAEILGEDTTLHSTMPDQPKLV